ncbi:uL13 family ribosomal protein, partial [Candidatus Roizmanbacteria bacterium]|nr:uL13 family ribosomal protein [Candidatus Roizmanbacteria bacterium]
RKPEEIIRHAVSGMLPKNKLRDQWLSRLYIYTDEKHPYQDKLKSKS